MKQLTAEWIAKAEGDFAIVERESRARRNPSYDGICFHAQQCVEKYIKARICEAGSSVQKLHDLSALLDQVLPFEPMWEAYRRELSYLSDYAVNFRYPGETSDRKTALQARSFCRAFRKAARAALGVDSAS